MKRRVHMNANGKKRITIADIARESGYSKTAVSFAFNAPERISTNAREKILRTAGKLRYIPDPTARNFSLGRHSSIGFLLPQSIDTCLLNPYIIDVMRGLGTVCQENGYMLTIIPPLNDSLYEAVKNATVDGLITMGYLISDGVGSLADVRAMPLVMIDGGDSDRFLSVNIDDEGAAYIQLSAALRAGHRKISIVSLPAPTLTPDFNEKGLIARRFRGYRKALDEFSVDENSLFYFQSEATYASGLALADEIMKTQPTCIVTMSDAQAYGIMDRLTSIGCSIPDDISIIGFDNIQQHGCVRKLTTIDQPGIEKGSLAARTLFSIMNGKKTIKAPVVPHRLIEGGTLRTL